MAIELNVTGRCKGCPAIKPLLQCDYAPGGTVPEYFMTCENLDLCQHIERHILEHPYRGPDLRELDI